MANDLPITNGVNGHGPSEVKEGGESSFSVKAGLARMLKGGVIMDVVNAEQVRLSSFSLSESPLQFIHLRHTFSAPNRS